MATQEPQTQEPPSSPEDAPLGGIPEEIPFTWEPHREIPPPDETVSFDGVVMVQINVLDFSSHDYTKLRSCLLVSVEN